MADWKRKTANGDEIAFPVADLRRLVSEGVISPGDQLSKGDGKWFLANQLPGLFDKPDPDKSSDRPNAMTLVLATIATLGFVALCVTMALETDENPDPMPALSKYGSVMLVFGGVLAIVSHLTMKK